MEEQIIEEEKEYIEDLKGQLEFDTHVRNKLNRKIAKLKKAILELQ